MTPKANNAAENTPSTATETAWAAETGTSASFGTDGVRQRNVTNTAGNSNAGVSNIPSPVSPVLADFIMGQINPPTLIPSAPADPAMTASPIYSPPSNLSTANIPPNPIFAQTLSNLAHYPYLSPMPSAGSIPASITSNGAISDQCQHLSIKDHLTIHDTKQCNAIISCDWSGRGNFTISSCFIKCTLGHCHYRCWNTSSTTCERCGGGRCRSSHGSSSPG